MRNYFIPSVTGRSPPCDFERALFALPARLSRLRITNPICFSSIESSASQKIYEPLQSLALSQSGVYSDNLRNAQLSLKSAVKHSKFTNALTAKADLLPNAPDRLQRSIC